MLCYDIDSNKPIHCLRSRVKPHIACNFLALFIRHVQRINAGCNGEHPARSILSDTCPFRHNADIAYLELVSP